MTRISEQNQATIELLKSTYANVENLVKFLARYRGPKNDNSGKKHIPKQLLESLFDRSWSESSTGNGHKKFIHRITNIVVEYSNHQDPVDKGAVVTIAGQIQDHINIFYSETLGYSVRSKAKRVPDFVEIAERLNSGN